jgi:hypothetical protein
MSLESIAPPSSARFWGQFSESAGIRDLDAEHIEKLSGVASEYGAAMEANVQSAVSNLHTSISWTQVALLGVLAFVFSKDSGTDGLIRGAALGVAWMLITNFAIRSAKNYINIMRFNLLRRSSLEFALGVQLNPERKKEHFLQWANTVRHYHVLWESPLRRRRLAKKVLIECGFVGPYAVIGALSCYPICITCPVNWPHVAGVGAGLFLAIVDVSFFLKQSLYLKNIRPDARLQPPPDEEKPQPPAGPQETTKSDAQPQPPV